MHTDPIGQPVSQGLGTSCVHAGRRELVNSGAHVPTLDLATTYPLPTVDDGGKSYEILATGGRPEGVASFVYSRLWNPTVDGFEQALAELEGCTDAVAFASGMAALTACVLATADAGCRHVIAVRPLYGGTDNLLTSSLLATEVTWCNAGQVGESIRPTTVLVVVESPANPTLEVLDIEGVASQCGDVPLLVDNTFATPILQQPARHGASLVLHSATKFIGGHSDVLGGVVACDAAWAARLRSVRAATGGVLHPFAAYLLHRGIQTLAVRVHAQQATAHRLASWLAEEATFAHRVYYPTLATEDNSGRPAQLRGSGCVLAFEVTGGFDAAAELANRCRVITHAVSLGGVGSLIEHPASLTHRFANADIRLPPGLLRLSVGLEDSDDLIEDLSQAARSLA